MDLRPARLRRGEWIAGVAAVLLTVFMFALSWYQPQHVPGRPTPASLNGWQGLTHLRWLVLVTILAALVLVLLQATRRAPALPVTCSLFVMLLGGVTVLALLYRVLVDPAGGMSANAGAYLGLLAAVAITYGGYRSMRTEGIAERDAAEVETVALGTWDRS
jgi:hypothetical protein